MKRLETLAELLPRGPVPPSAPSPDINWSMLVSHLSICIVGCYNLHKFWTCLYQFFFFFTMSLLLCCVYNNLIFCVNLSLFHHLLHLSGANLIDSTCEGYKFFISYFIIMDKKIFYNISYFCSPFFISCKISYTVRTNYCSNNIFLNLSIIVYVDQLKNGYRYLVNQERITRVKNFPGEFRELLFSLPFILKHSPSQFLSPIYPTLNTKHTPPLPLV